VRFLVATALAVIVALGPGATSAPAPSAGEPSELIVRFERGVTAADRREVRADAGTELERTLPVQGMQLLTVEPGQPTAAAERALESADGVAYAEPNVVRRAFVRPNDPNFSLLWGLENTGQSIRGVSGTPDADSDVAEAWDAGVGGGTVVAVVDTGVDGTHPDLTANTWRNPGESGSGRESNGVDDDTNGRVDDWRGWDFVAGDNDPADENGHGTHVAGTVAADRGNGVGVAGVADGAELMPLRVLDGAGSGRVSDTILAYSYAFANGARVVNLSLGSTSSSRAERDAIAAYPSMLFVAAAGNGGADGIGDDNDASGTYPCAYLLPNVVCVAASDNSDQLAGFSNYGTTSVDLAAPGVDIASTWPAGAYSWSSGTSMATPHVAGAAALMWAAAPESQAPDIAAALMSGVDALPAFSGRTVSGGRLNVLRSLKLVADVGIGAPAPVPSPPASDPGSSGSPGGSASPPPSPPPSSGTVSDSVAPRLSVRAGRRFRRMVLVRHRLPVRVSCSERCSVRLGLRLGRRSLTAPVTIALASGVAKRVTLRLTPAGRRLIRRRASLSLTLRGRALDSAGNSGALRLRLRVSR
jgi:subtilisin family serine protease